MESPSLFWLMMVTFGIVLVLAVVDLLKTKGDQRSISSTGTAWNRPQPLDSGSVR